MKEFTPEELSTFDGEAGRPVYVALEGKVYDVSKSRLWSKGIHMNRHPAGKDLSGDIIAAPHGKEVLERYPQVGLLRQEAREEMSHLPLLLQGLLQKIPMARRHPHPMVVHFPIAYLMASSLFVILHLLLRAPSFERTAFYLLVLGSLASPFAMATGLLTWWINYRLKLSPLVKKKIALSAVLLVLESILLLWKGKSEEVLSPLSYGIAVLLLVPVVTLLGYYGGQMTFPEGKKK